MIEVITNAYIASGQNPNVAELVNYATRASYDAAAEADKFLTAEREIHDEFDGFVALRDVVASRRYRAYVGGKQWHTEAFTPIPLVASQDDRILQVVPYKEYNVEDRKWEVTHSGNSSSHRLIPSEEQLIPRAIGFFIAESKPSDILRRAFLREPWASHKHTDVGVAARISPDNLPSCGMVITPVRTENQRRFAELLHYTLLLDKTNVVSAETNTRP